MLKVNHYHTLSVLLHVTDTVKECYNCEFCELKSDKNKKISAACVPSCLPSCLSVCLSNSAVPVWVRSSLSVCQLKSLFCNVIKCDCLLLCIFVCVCVSLGLTDIN